MFGKSVCGEEKWFPSWQVLNKMEFYVLYTQNTEQPQIETVRHD